MHTDFILNLIYTYWCPHTVIYFLSGIFITAAISGSDLLSYLLTYGLLLFCSSSEPEWHRQCPCSTDAFEIGLHRRCRGPIRSISGRPHCSHWFFCFRVSASSATWWCFQNIDLCLDFVLDELIFLSIWWWNQDESCSVVLIFGCCFLLCLFMMRCRRLMNDVGGKGNLT